jgi:glycosyltransferase involved in cell wall biosynthesis
VPVLVSELGGLPELAGPDASLPSRDPRAWELALGALWNDPDERERQGEAARERALARASPARAYESLLGVYERAGARTS